MPTDPRAWERPAVMGVVLTALIVVGAAIGAYAGSSVADGERDRLSECSTAQIATLDRAAVVAAPIGATPDDIPTGDELNATAGELVVLGEELQMRAEGECRASSDPGFLRRVTELHREATEAVSDLARAVDTGDPAAQQEALDRLAEARLGLDDEICAQTGCEEGPDSPAVPTE